MLNYHMQLLPQYCRQKFPLSVRSWKEKHFQRVLWYSIDSAWWQFHVMETVPVFETGNKQLFSKKLLWTSFGVCVRGVCSVSPNPESQIPNPESRIPNPESHIAKTVLVRTSTVSQNHTVSFPFQNHTVSFPRSVRTTINIACVTPLLSYWFVSDRFLTG